MQTYLVHTRQPARLFRELGTKRFFGFQVLMGGVLLSALVHPWFYVLAALEATYGLFALAADAVTGRLLWWIGIFNLVTGYVTGVALGSVAVTRRGRQGLAVHALLMPLYWLLISFAAYLALWQLVTAPHYWAKTEHAPRPPAAGSEMGTSGDRLAAGDPSRQGARPADIALS